MPRTVAPCYRKVEEHAVKLIGMAFAYHLPIALTVKAGGVEPTNHLLPRDFRLPEASSDSRSAVFAESTVELDGVIKSLRAKARVGLVLLDACRDNPFAAEEIALASADASRGVARSRTSLTRGLSQAVIPSFSSAPEPAKSSTPLNKARGMIIAYATAPGELAEDGNGAHSPFSAALLKSIKAPGRSIDLMLREVATDVNTATKGAQTPWVVASLLGGEFFLVPPLPVTRPTATPATVASPPKAVIESSRPRPTVSQASSRPASSGGSSNASRPATSGRAGGSSLPPGIGTGAGVGL